MRALLLESLTEWPFCVVVVLTFADSFLCKNLVISCRGAAHCIHVALISETAERYLVCRQDSLRLKISTSGANI